jgi:hypothetical protein
MLRKSRSDGTLLQDIPHFTQILPYLIPRRTDASIFFEQELDVSRTLEYIRGVNAERPGALSFFQVFLCAAARTIALRPKLNRFVSGYRYYQRNEILMGLVAKRQLTDEGQEFVVTLPMRPDETLSTLPPRVKDQLALVRQGTGGTSDDANVLLTKLPPLLLRAAVRAIVGLDNQNLLPESFIKSLPFWATAFITNVGSVGIDAPFHHHFNLGTCGLVLALGKIRKVPVLTEHGTVEQRDVVKVTFTFDSRIVDGIYCARAVDLFREFVEHPERLEDPPELTPALRAELMLKD